MADHIVQTADKTGQHMRYFCSGTVTLWESSVSPLEQCVK